MAARSANRFNMVRTYEGFNGFIAQNEHVKVIADRLGHANPMVTMTTYAHLFDGLDIAAADRLDEAWARSVTDPGRTQPEVGTATESL